MARWYAVMTVFMLVAALPAHAQLGKSMDDVRIALGMPTHEAKPIPPAATAWTYPEDGLVYTVGFNDSQTAVYLVVKDDAAVTGDHLDDQAIQAILDRNSRDANAGTGSWYVDQNNDQVKVWRRLDQKAVAIYHKRRDVLQIFYSDFKRQADDLRRQRVSDRVESVQSNF